MCPLDVLFWFYLGGDERQFVRKKTHNMVPKHLICKSILFKMNTDGVFNRVSKTKSKGSGRDDV